MGITVAAAAGYLAAFGLFRKGFIRYQLIILIIFLVHLVFLEQLDNTLPIYIIAAVLPFIGEIKIKDKALMGLLALYASYLIIGIASDDITETLTTFLAKISQFIVFFLFAEYGPAVKRAALLRSVQIAAVAETLLGIYLYSASTSYAQSGLRRLVINSQPIVGNIGVAVLPVILWLYFNLNNNGKIQAQLLFYSTIFLFWTILSGTRGYVILFACPLALMFIDYLFCTGGRKIRTVKRRMAAFIIITTVAVTAGLFYSGIIIAKIEEVLRVKETLGVRDEENMLCLTFFKNSSLLVKIFGIGLGGRASDYYVYRAAVAEAMGNSWTYNAYIHGTGAVFHNLYANILLTQGILGLSGVLAVIAFIMRRIAAAFRDNRSLRRSLWVYTACFFVVNWFRWSASCGIAEMIMLACAINLRLPEATPANTGIKNL